MVVNQTGTRRAVVQLLLLALPLLLTLHAFVELPDLTDASHQLHRHRVYRGYPIYEQARIISRPGHCLIYSS